MRSDLKATHELDGVDLPKTSSLKRFDFSVLSFSLDRWTDVWRSRHHVMSEFARERKVLFVSPALYIRDVLRRNAADSEISGVTEVRNNLYSYVPPRWLPDSFRYPSLDRVIKRTRYRQMRSVIRRLGFTRPVVYVWHPAFIDVIGHFDEALVAYHCYDEYASFYPDGAQKDALIEQEQRLLSRADVVFAASEELAARRLPFNANTHVVRNGVDYALFSRAQDRQTNVPDDIRAIRRPLIGCVTTQTPFMDLPLLRAIFERRSDWSFAFIGVDRTTDDRADKDLMALQNLPNVHFIGRRPLDAIPGYLKGCDVCAIPWLLNDVTLVSSSPLKLYEYMAAGKPIVCKPLPLIKHLSHVIEFADSADEWVAAIEQALRNDGPQLIEHRQQMARDNTWESRVRFISSKLTERWTALQTRAQGA